MSSEIGEIVKKYISIIVPAVLGMLLLGYGVFFYFLPHSREMITAERKDLTEERTKAAYQIIESFYIRAKMGELKPEEAKKWALNLLSSLRFDDDNQNYIWLLTTEGRILSHPYRSDYLGLDLLEIRDSKGRPFVRSMLEIAKRNGHGYVEYTWQYKGDTERITDKLTHIRLFRPWGWVIGAGVYIEDINDRVEGLNRDVTMVMAMVLYLVMFMALLMIWQNISSERRREEAVSELRASDEKLKAIAAGALDGIIIMDSNGLVAFWNRAASNIFGYDAIEVMGRDLHMILAPKRYEKQYLEKLSHFSKEGSGAAIGQTIELVGRHKDGHEFPVELAISSLYLQGAWHAVGVVRDITLRKQATQALMESQERLSTIINATPENIYYLKDGQGRLLKANEAALDFVGLSGKEYTGKTFDELAEQYNIAFRGLSRALESEEDAWQAGKRIRREGPRLDVNNNEYYLDVIYIPIFDKNGGRKAMVVAARDITYKEKARKEREDMDIRLRHAQKMEAVGTLAGGIAHDFNNILTVIMGYGESALRKSQDNPAAKEKLKVILEAGIRGRDLVKQLLTFSRDKETDNRACDLSAIAAETMNFMEAVLPAQVAMNWEMNEPGLVVSSDPTRLQQVIINLCTNAIQAMGENGGLLSVGLTRVEVRPGRGNDNVEPGDYARLEVSDTGPGIGREVRKHIFDPFFTQKARSGGTGLGLAVVHGIVTSMGGRVNVESEPGEGAVFSVLLPLISGGDREKAAIDQYQDSSSFKGVGKVLLVEDEKPVLDMLVELIIGFGFDPVACLDPVEARRIFEKSSEDYCLVITDFAMPNMSGLELANSIKETSPGTPVLLCTGQTQAPDLAESALFGVDAILSKPFNSGELAGAISNLLDKNQAS